MDLEDDGSEVLGALEKLTPKVNVGPKVSQRTRKSQIQPLTKARIAHIARQVKSGEIQLPEIKLEDNSEYEYFWALLDSCAGRSCAKKAKHFPKVKIPNSPSSVRMSTANRNELHSRGTFQINARTSEGHVISPTFEDADVEMPIVAITDIATNGHDGTETLFRCNGGEIVDFETRNKSNFIRRNGVYFMKMYYKTDQCSSSCNHSEPESDFIRPGNP